MQTGKEDSKKQPEYYHIDDPGFESSVDQGVMPDEYSSWTITKWTTIISVVVVVLIIFSFNLYSYVKFNQEFDKAVRTEYRELQNLRSQADEKITTFKVIDDEEGIYRIPVDSAMSLIIRDYQQD